MPEKAFTPRPMRSPLRLTLALALVLAGPIPAGIPFPAMASRTIRLSATPAESPPVDEATSRLCRNATAQVERALRLPEGFLSAISRVETGRPGTDGTLAPWPWSINANGASHYYATRLEAVTAVQALQQQGVQSIDVGCLQVNLLHHRGAFPSLEVAFDPYSNARYAGMFLQRMRDQAGSWPRAAAAYHSQTASMGATYLQQVLRQWAIPLENHLSRSFPPGFLPVTSSGDGRSSPSLPIPGTGPATGADTPGHALMTMNQPAKRKHDQSQPRAAGISQAGRGAIRSLANAHEHMPLRPGAASPAWPASSPAQAQATSVRPGGYDRRQFRPFRGLFRPAMPPPPHQRMKSAQQGRGLASYRAMPVHDVSPMPHPSAY